MTTLTTYEAAILNSIAYNEMNPANGWKPESRNDTGCYVWADHFANDSKVEITVPQVKGVLASLVQKELIVISPYDERDNQVDFTDTGFTAWQSVDDNRKE